MCVFAPLVDTHTYLMHEALSILRLSSVVETRRRTPCRPRRKGARALARLVSPKKEKRQQPTSSGPCIHTIHAYTHHRVTTTSLPRLLLVQPHPKTEKLCAKIPDAAGALSHLDGDTAVSHNSFEAAMRAAGSVCDAVDRVMTGRNRNAFCAVRPPGHHAGPRGLVTCGNDTQGSHGFCLLNNVVRGYRTDSGWGEP